MQYLKLWKQHRNVENLARAGWGRTLGGAIEEMAWNQVMAPYAVHEIELRWIDWNEVKPGRMLGMSKAEVKVLAGRWDWQTADAWAVYRCWQGGCTAEEFDRCRAELGPEGLQVLVGMIEDGHEVPLLKAARYIKKQEQRRGGDLARTFLDYREMLDADATEEELWPKDLVAAHDRLAELHGDRNMRQYTEAMRQLAQELAALAWSDGEICIRAAATPGELKEEGRVLKHCVGDYCKKHAARTDVIFFVRHARRPERSWYTLDINMTGRIPKEVQLHGYRNEWYGKAGHRKNSAEGAGFLRPVGAARCSRRGTRSGRRLPVKTSRRGGKRAHERDNQRADGGAAGHQDGDNGDPDAAPAGAVHGAGVRHRDRAAAEGSKGDARPRPVGAVAAGGGGLLPVLGQQFHADFRGIRGAAGEPFRGRKFASAWEFAPIRTRCGCWHCRRRSARASRRSTTRRS